MRSRTVLGISALIVLASIAYGINTEPATLTASNPEPIPGGLAMFASHTNNTTSGGLDLRLSDSNESFSDGVTASWGVENMLPGTASSGSVTLSEVGEAQGDYVNIRFNTSSVDPGCEAGNNEEPDTLCGAEGMAGFMQTVSMSYGQTSFDMSPGSDFEDLNSNGFIDLEDLEQSQNYPALSNLTAPGDTNITFEMELQFDESADNRYQGDIIEMDLTATLYME